MEKRLQTVNGDTVLEITQDAPVKSRFSEKALLRNKEYLEESIATFQSSLSEVNARLSMIAEEKMQTLNDQNKIGGFLTIKRFRDGKLIWHSEPMKNKVVTSSGYGRNLLARKLAGDNTYPIEIDSAAVGTSNTAAADAQTNLITPTVTSIPITGKSATDDVFGVDVFIADGNLPNNTYQEFGLFCTGRLFARIVISPSYTKASGEDTLFSYECELTG